MNKLILFFVITLVTLSSTVSSARLDYSVGINIDPTNTQGGNASIPQLQQLQGGWIRVEFKDTATGPNFDPQTWNLYDNMLRSYKAAGFKLLLILDYQTAVQVPWGQSSADWANYAKTIFGPKVEQIATRYIWYGGNDIAFEIWNEPDLKATNVPAVEYANLLAQAYIAIRFKAKSNSSVVMGGLASGNPGYVDQVREASPNKILACDWIALHPYGQRPSNSWPSPTWGFGSIEQLLANYKRASDLPFIISEVGTADMTVQGSFPQHFFAAVKGQVVATIWFCFSDGMVNPFGLLDKSGNKKPSWNSFIQFVKGG